MEHYAYLGLSPAGFHHIAYTSFQPDTAADARSGPPVVCVHGLTRNGRDFDMLATQLADTRRVVCPDVVGRGRSDWLPDCLLYTSPSPRDS